MRKKRSIRDSNYFGSLLLTVLVVLSLFYFSSASAVNLSIHAPSTVDEKKDITFNAAVDIEGNELVPITNLSIEIGDEKCFFYPNGTKISGGLCNKLSIKLVTSANYSLGRGFGYGYGLINGSYANDNTTFFNGGFGYGWTDTGHSKNSYPYGDLSYNITWTAPSVSRDTNFNISLKAYTSDSAKRKNFAVKKPVSIKVKDIPRESTSKSGGSSSSGGGSYIVPSVVITGSQTEGIKNMSFRLKLNPGATTKILVNNDAIESIIIVAKKSRHVKLALTQLDYNPTHKKLPARVYKFIKITHENLSNNEIETAEVVFRVKKSWLNQYDIDASDIALYRFNNNKWTELSTKVSRADRNYVYFSAVTPGFSYFAIGVKQKTIPTETTPKSINATKKPGMSKTVQHTVKPTTKKAIEEHPEQLQTKPGYGITDVIILIIIFVLTLAVLTYLVLFFGPFRKYRYALYVVMSHYAYLINYYRSKKILNKATLARMAGDYKTEEKLLEKYHELAKKANQYYRSIHLFKLYQHSLMHTAAVKKMAALQEKGLDTTEKYAKLRDKAAFHKTHIDYHRKVLALPVFTIDFILRGLHKPNSDFQSAKEYLKQMLEKSGSMEDAKRHLIEAGWPEYTVELLAHNIHKFNISKLKMLEQYIKGQKAKGKTNEEIMKMLTAFGWPETLVEAVLYNVHHITTDTKNLNSYILHCLSKGETPSTIKRRLIKFGWSEELINNILEKGEA